MASWPIPKSTAWVSKAMASPPTSAGKIRSAPEPATSWATDEKSWVPSGTYSSPTTSPPAASMYWRASSKLRRGHT